MKTNMSRLDQILRFGISVILIYIGFIDETVIYDPLSSNIVGAFGVVNLVAAIIRTCPLYAITGIDTCRKSK